jgi:hypothetical protein
MGEMKDTTTQDLTARPNDAANDAYGMYLLACLADAWLAAFEEEDANRLASLMAALGYC